MTYEEIRANPDIRIYIQQAKVSLGSRQGRNYTPDCLRPTFSDLRRTENSGSYFTLSE